MAATAKSIPFPSPKQEPTTTEPVTQAELALLLSLRDRLRQFQAQVEAEEESVKARLEASASVEPGLLTAILKTIERRSVAWKQVCERELGEPYCRRVLAATKPETYVSLAVTVGGAS